MAEPAKEALVWEVAPQLRAFFLRNAGKSRFVARFDEDMRIWISLRDHIECQIFLHGVQEGDRGLIRFLKRVWESGQVFFDVGANVGVQSLMAAKRVGRDGAVHCFEPVDATRQRLQLNLELNDLGHVTVIAAALSNRDGFALISIPRHANKGMATLHAPDGAGAYQRAKLMPLDKYVEESAVAQLDVIKLDVEGHEMRVVEGGANSIARFRPLIACELSRIHLVRAGSSPEAVCRFLRSLDYERWSLSEQGFLREALPLSDHENAVFLPCEMAVPQAWKER